MSKFAFIFPGQGSQTIGMLSDLATEYFTVRAVFEEVSDALQYDVWKLTQEGPLEVLNQTAHTQVAMLAADIAVFRVIESAIPSNSILAGHSLGEYAALVAAKVITLTDAAHLVQRRGQLMQETIPLGKGAMAAIVGLTDEQVKQICLDASTQMHQVSPANFNAIGQVVVAGHTEAVEKAITLAIQANARLATLIPVSVPCHCDLLRPAADQFMNVLQQVSFSKPERLVLSTVDLNDYSSMDDIPSKLASQLYLPVRWVEIIQKMQHQGVTQLFECGPGKVLGGLVKRIDKSLAIISINQPSSVQEAKNILCH